MVTYLLVVITLTCVLASGEEAHPPLQSIVFHSQSHTWCEARPIQQIVTHPGCDSQSVDNQVCVGQCYSYSVPKTLPSQAAGLLQRHDVCKPAKARWEKVTLQCAEGHKLPKFVQIIEECACASCSAAAVRQSEMFASEDDAEEKKRNLEEAGAVDCSSCDSDIVLGETGDADDTPDAKLLDQLQRDLPPGRADYSLDNFLIRQAQERMLELRKGRLHANRSVTEGQSVDDVTQEDESAAPANDRATGRGLEALLSSRNVTSPRARERGRGLDRAARRRLLVMLERRRKQNSDNAEHDDEKSAQTGLTNGQGFMQRSPAGKKTL